MPAAAAPGRTHPRSPASARATAMSGRRSPETVRSDAGDLACLVPVDREQHGTEHDAVVAVELVPDGGEQVLAGSGRVLLTPGRDGGPRPGQFRRVVVPEPHRRLLI